MATDSGNNVYITDSNNHRIRKVDAGTGNITTVAGTSSGGFSGDGGPATIAELNYPYNMAVDSGGNLYIADQYNHRIRKVDAGTGNIATIAGTGSAGFGGDGGPATSAQLNYPSDVAVDGAGNVSIADSNNNRIRRIDAGTGTITTVVGGGDKLGDEGPGTEASLSYSVGVTALTDGTLFIADTYNHRVRKLDTGGFIHTVAGSGQAGFAGDGGTATGYRIRAAASGYTDGISVTQVVQPQFVVTINTNITTFDLTTPFQVYADVPGYGAQRLAADTTVSMVSTNPAVLSVPASVTIANNALTPSRATPAPTTRPARPRSPPAQAEAGSATASLPW